MPGSCEPQESKQFMNTPTNNSLTEIFGEVIYSYTRAQALEDGELVDVTETAREAGFKLPFAVSRALWNVIETIPSHTPWQGLARPPLGVPLDGQGCHPPGEAGDKSRRFPAHPHAAGNTREISDSRD